eukprot:gb/GECG01007185.1/.p1 GENE.gb/GECG01007185.1/~~gb/GECG01007185.1/.p1  ORF type:complete len:128 (+),score=9.31 gb/GECG01007185.1/:1-384(+)
MWTSGTANPSLVDNYPKRGRHLQGRRNIKLDNLSLKQIICKREPPSFQNSPKKVPAICTTEKNRTELVSAEELLFIATWPSRKSDKEQKRKGTHNFVCMLVMERVASPDTEPQNTLMKNSRCNQRTV